MRLRVLPATENLLPVSQAVSVGWLALVRQLVAFGRLARTGHV